MTPKPEELTDRVPLEQLPPAMRKLLASALRIRGSKRKLESGVYGPNRDLSKCGRR